MKKSLFYVAILMFAAAAGCKSYSKHTIDEKPLIKADTRLLGIWKAVEDTNRLDYISVQSYDDVYNGYAEWICEFHQKEIDSPGIKDRVRDLIIQRYKEGKERKDNCYYITRMDHDGLNPHYQQWLSFPSVVNGATFINIPYRHIIDDDRALSPDNVEKGYFFVRIISINEDAHLMTIAVVADPSLKYLESSAEVRKRIAEKMNTSSYYSDTLHFYKASNYHASLKNSVVEANRLGEVKH